MDFALPHIYSVRTILINPSRIQPAPVRYPDLFEDVVDLVRLHVHLPSKKAPRCQVASGARQEKNAKPGSINRAGETGS